MGQFVGILSLFILVSTAVGMCRNWGISRNFAPLERPLILFHLKPIIIHDLPFRVGTMSLHVQL